MIRLRLQNTAIPVLRALITSLRAEFTTALEEAAGAAFEVCKDEYFKAQSYEGEPWKPLAKATEEWKKRKGYKKPYHILNVTGSLMGNWQAVPLRYGVVLWGTNVKYAALHQYGGTITIGPHTVREHKVKPHWIKRHKVREHTRTAKSGKVSTIKEHWVKRHKVGKNDGYAVKEHKVKGSGKRTIPARPFLPANRRVYELLCDEIPDAMASHGIPCECVMEG